MQPNSRPKILLTGANGYIGSRLLQLLLKKNYQVVALLRNLGGENTLPKDPNLSIIYADLTNRESLAAIPKDIDVAYYLVHAMSSGDKNFPKIEEQSIHNFIDALKTTQAKQIIYLSGLCDDKNLSPHLASRYKTECTIKASGIPYTILRAGIIIGSGSASFEIIRDLAEKLPVMVAPRWVNNRCQPISIDDVLRYLLDVIGHSDCLNQAFDIGGPEILTYKEMLLKYAEIQKLKRYIFVVPVLTPKLSSYWLYFVTSVNFPLAASLVDSVKNEVYCHENKILQIFPQPCINYQKSIEKAVDLIEQNPLLPGWKDSMLSGQMESNLTNLAKVPTYGCLIDKRLVETDLPPKEVIDRIWCIGGSKGWYYMDWAWGLRGFFDKIIGGIGLNRGRTYANEIHTGSSIDFWRVLMADKANGRLLLYAEMKVPGEAWLEFSVIPEKQGSILKQTASFRPHGVFGRLYWYSLLPIHKLIFQGMATTIASPKESWKDRFLDKTILFSFDQTGFKRHAQKFAPDDYRPAAALNALVTGGTSGIGFETALQLAQKGANVTIVSRDAAKGKQAADTIRSKYPQAKINYARLNLGELKDVYQFAQNYPGKIDILIHDAGAMPLQRTLTSEGNELVFASQVLGPYVLTRTFIDQNKFNPNARIVFVSSGGMYLKGLNLEDLNFEKHTYNKYEAYSNAKRAQVILTEQLAKNYPQYIFSAMHPGWADTPGVEASMPVFYKIMKHRLRTLSEGADTILWLALTSQKYPSGKFWFDRKEVPTQIKTNTLENISQAENLWNFCEPFYKKASHEYRD